MAEDNQVDPVILRDGTSQASRALEALNPDFVSVDERTLRDWLGFARKYATQLVFFDAEGLPAGDWSGLFRFGEPADEAAQNAMLDEVADLVSHPERWPEARFDRYRQAHFLLVLAFLRALGAVQSRLNGFTRRHLDFAYRDVLGFSPRPATPDRVHVLIELAAGSDEVLLPAGTRLLAGSAGEGGDRVFSTDSDLVANRARVASLKGLHVDRRVIGLDDVRRNPEVLIGLVSQQPAWVSFVRPNKALMAMLELAFRDSKGGSVPLRYPQPGPAGPLSGTPVNVDEALLGSLDRLLEFVVTQLFLPLPVFRVLMQLKRGLDPKVEPAASRWVAINDSLTKAGRAKRNDPNFKLPANPPDFFEGNLKASLNLPANAFDGLPEVEDVYGLYRHLDAPEVPAFIRKWFFLEVEEFSAMMGLVEAAHADWQRIHETLRGAGRRKQRKFSAHKIEPTKNLREYDPKLWDNLVQRNLGDLRSAFPQVRGVRLSDLDQVYDEICRLEACFHMPAEDFQHVRTALAPETGTPAWEFEEVNEILTKAAWEKVIAQRRSEIAAARDGVADIGAGLDAMVRRALGYPAPGDPLPGGRRFMDLRPQSDVDYIRDDLRLTTDNVRFLQGIVGNRKVRPEDWQAAASILEQAERRKQGRTPQPLAVESWENVYAAFDATKVQAGSSSEQEDAAMRWRTFGDAYRADGATSPGALGFMIASPILALSEGLRVIILTLECSEDGFDRAAIDAILKKQDTDPPFRFLVSTKKGWFEARVDGPTAIRSAAPAALRRSKALRAAPPTIEFRLRLDVRDPAVEPMPPGSNLPEGCPILEVLLSDQGSGGSSRKRYGPFRTLRLTKASIRVEVNGLADLSLQNDESVLDARKPFEPFGSSPAVGSRLNFSHPEICSKKLESLQVGINWLGAPTDFAKFYEGYLPDWKSPIANNDALKAGLKLRDSRALIDIADVRLFPSTKAPSLGHVVEDFAFGVEPGEIQNKYASYSRDLDPQMGEEPLEWSRYWVLELQAPDFQHANYAQAAARAATRMDSSTPPKPNPLILSPPYTPKVKRLRLYYRAAVEIQPGAKGPDRFLHVEPFGYGPATSSLTEAGVLLLPQVDDEGQLYIGLENLVPPQNICLLFQVAPGSADPDLTPEPVRWSYLNGLEWVTLDEGRVLSDTTANLINSGIVTFDLPLAPAGTRLPPDRYWLRASIARNSRSVADLVDVRAQAVSATRADETEDHRRLEHYLPPNSVTGLADPRPDIEAVHQPYSSQDGAPRELELQLYRRVSERLRHKDRALTSWDYERLILEAFPDIYKVKCLPVDTSEDPRLAALVRVILIPDIRGRRPFDPFEPKVPAETLRAVEAFLARRSPALARVRVQNPRYATLQLRFGVRLRPGCNPGFYLKRLNDDLQRYLSPWAYDESADILFGGRITGSLIVHFVEQRPYVDYLARMRLFLNEDGIRFQEVSAEDLDRRSGDPATADLILVSAREHIIDLITEEFYVDESFTGINHMKIELDFQVAADDPKL